MFLNSKYSIQKGSNANADNEESDDSGGGNSADDQHEVPH